MAEPSILFKHLLKKHMDGIASNNEEATLRLMWHLFDDEEIVDFIEELQQEMPVNLRESKTDSAALTAAILRKAKEKQAKKLKGRRVRILSWAAASIFIVVIMLVVFNQRQESSNNILCDNSGNGNIPTKDFYCLLQVNSTQRLVIDSNYKGMLCRYGKMAVLVHPGVVQYKAMPYSATADSLREGAQQISTNNMQQYVVELPDRTRIRLNAMTTIKIYPDRLNSKGQFIELEKGEIYIEGDQRSDVPLVLKTPSITFIATGSHFNTQIDKRGTLLAVETGEVAVENSHGERIVRECPDLSHYSKSKSLEGKDTVNTYNISDIDLVTNWRRTERMYKDVQLDYFVADMARWYGFKFTSLDCLPKKKISTVICYRANIKDFIAVLRNSGVRVRETREGYAFCDPVAKASQQMAIVENRIKIRGEN
ncbi:FecR family protein [Niabella beijingensis]|uniref:FecR family protein n=1 Tax=Niabella beijingensis TaxID=2872700 RepID=UPI001CC14C4E|nr:FecR family protein [Niabella beijingensis]MBZ4189316.1 FecR family protein [Niabella beijingensis]